MLGEETAPGFGKIGREVAVAGDKELKSIAEVADLRAGISIWYNCHMAVLCQQKNDCSAGNVSIPRLLVHVHVFYPAIWQELADCVDNFVAVVGWDHLDVRVTVSELHQEVVELVRLRLPNAKIEVVENRGYDVAPYLKILDEVNLEDYDYVVKLHTKRDVNCWINFRRLQGPAWRRELLSFCDSESHVRRTLKRLSKRPRLGMIAGSGVIDPSGVASPVGGMSPNEFARIVDLLREIGLRLIDKTMVHGTMFIVRAELHKVLVGKIGQSRFHIVEETDNHVDLGFAVDVERLLAMLVTAQGCYIGSGRFPDGIAIFLNWLKGMILCGVRHLSNLARGVP